MIIKYSIGGRSRNRLAGALKWMVVWCCLTPSLVWGGEIHLAILGGDLAKVKTLVQGNAKLVESADENGIKPLHYAALRDQKEIAKYLLEQKADVNA
ncbi:MAG: ankyrin repeat domain-containing protein, partial [Planctomycetaceae bacterium]|nr:ankyrin repeat domain-containing protein [Planctomycetaceae bacterium]